MGIDDRVFADEASARLQDDLRQQVAAALLDRADLITADAVAIFPHSGLESLDADYCGRLGNLLTQLLAFAVRDGRVDSRGGFIADLHRVDRRTHAADGAVFTFVYFTERTALDELALDERLGATSEPWARRRPNRPARRRSTCWPPTSNVRSSNRPKRRSSTS